MSNNQASDVRLMLSEVATRLKASHRYKRSKSAGRQELLNLLMNGSLKAKIEFPTAGRPSLDIPDTYWKDVAPGEFRQALNRNNNKNKTGDYLIQSAEMAIPYAAWFFHNGASKDELEAVLRAAKRRIPVYILESDWTKFVEETHLDTREVTNVQPRSRAGKHEHEKWAPILVQVAGILIAEGARSDRAAEEVAEHAKSRLDDGDPSIPKIGSIAGKIRQIRQVAKDISRRK